MIHDIDKILFTKITELKDLLLKFKDIYHNISHKQDTLQIFNKFDENLSQLDIK